MPAQEVVEAGEAWVHGCSARSTSLSLNFTLPLNLRYISLLYLLGLSPLPPRLASTVKRLDLIVSNPSMKIDTLIEFDYCVG